MWFFFLHSYILWVIWIRDKTSKGEINLADFLVLYFFYAYCNNLVMMMMLDISSCSHPQQSTNHRAMSPCHLTSPGTRDVKIHLQHQIINWYSYDPTSSIGKHSGNSISYGSSFCFDNEKRSRMWNHSSFNLKKRCWWVLFLLLNIAFCLENWSRPRSCTFLLFSK